MTPRPLAGRTVLDLSQYIAGPACGQLLGDFGASVIKIEPPAGDPSRALGTSAHGSGYFRQYNTGKRSLILDLTTEAGRREMDERLAGADAIVMNYSHRTLRKLGLDWETLHAQFPCLVVACISAYGYGDDRTAFDSIAQAVSGYGYMNADEHGVPRITAGYPTDVFSGLYAGLATAMALLDPRRSEGVLVDVSMVEIAMNALCGTAMLAAAAGESLEPGHGNRDAATAPSNVFACADGHVYIYAGLDKHWNLLRPLVGGDEASLAERLADPDRFDATVEAWTSSRTVAEVCEAVGALGIAAGAVTNPIAALEAFHSDRPDGVVTVDPAAGPVPQFPVTFSGQRVPRQPAPVRDGEGIDAS